jgi:hypothetical protein
MIYYNIRKSRNEEIPIDKTLQPEIIHMIIGLIDIGGFIDVLIQDSDDRGMLFSYLFGGSKW